MFGEGIKGKLALSIQRESEQAVPNVPQGPGFLNSEVSASTAQPRQGWGSRKGAVIALQDSD